MNAQTLLEIVNTQLHSNDGNPTSKSFLYELALALERLKDYESKDDSQYKKVIDKTIET